MPCWGGKPNERHLFADMFIKRRFCLKKLCRICCMLSVYGLKFMISPSLSLGFDFHIQVDFGFNDLFSHIFSFLHHNSIETSWFSHMNYQKPLTKEKSMESSLDTCRLMLPRPVSRGAHLRSQKQKSNQIRSVEVFDFKHYLTGPSGCTEAMGFRQSESMGSFGS